MSMESQANTQQNPGNAQVISNQNPPGPASADSTAQIAPPDTGDLQELYQMIKSLKDQYFVELNDLYNKVSIKIQHIDNHMPSQKSAEQYEKMNGFKVMLERMLHFLQVNKSNIQPSFREKIPIYERQIQSILSSQIRKSVQAPGLQMFQQSASVDSAAQTGHPGASDLQEELYQMIKSLKDQYFMELNDLYHKISMKIQHIDNHMPSQKSAEQYEKMKNFNVMLENMLHFLQVNKSSIQPSFRKKIPFYERQIISILSLRKRKPSGGPALSSNISQQHQDSQSLQEHDSHTNQKPQASIPSMYTGGSNSKRKKQNKPRCHLCKNG